MPQHSSDDDIDGTRRRHPDPLVRFWDRVAKGDGCWEWTGAVRKPQGYGYMVVRFARHYAHRFSWTLHNGQIPYAKYVCHRCDNRRCVRPDHLFLGTHAENMADASRKDRIGRRKLTDEDVRVIRRRIEAGDAGAAIARSFGVNQALVWQIKTGRAHVERGLP